jgi:hypothetical protein
LWASLVPGGALGTCSVTTLNPVAYFKRAPGGPMYYVGRCFVVCVVGRGMSGARTQVGWLLLFLFCCAYRYKTYANHTRPQNKNTHAHTGLRAALAAVPGLERRRRGRGAQARRRQERQQCQCQCQWWRSARARGLWLVDGPGPPFGAFFWGEGGQGC